MASPRTDIEYGSFDLYRKQTQKQQEQTTDLDFSSYDLHFKRKQKIHGQTLVHFTADELEVQGQDISHLYAARQTNIELRDREVKYKDPLPIELQALKRKLFSKRGFDYSPRPEADVSKATTVYKSSPRSEVDEIFQRLKGKAQERGFQRSSWSSVEDLSGQESDQYSPRQSPVRRNVNINLRGKNQRRYDKGQNDHYSPRRREVKSENRDIRVKLPVISVASDTNLIDPRAFEGLESPRSENNDDDRQTFTGAYNLNSSKSKNSDTKHKRNDNYSFQVFKWKGEEKEDFISKKYSEDEEDEFLQMIRKKKRRRMRKKARMAFLKASAFMSVPSLDVEKMITRLQKRPDKTSPKSMRRPNESPTSRTYRQSTGSAGKSRTESETRRQLEILREGKISRSSNKEAEKDQTTSERDKLPRIPPETQRERRKRLFSQEIALELRRRRKRREKLTLKKAEILGFDDDDDVNPRGESKVKLPSILKEKRDEDKDKGRKSVSEVESESEERDRKSVRFVV